MNIWKLLVMSTIQNIYIYSLCMGFLNVFFAHSQRMPALTIKGNASLLLSIIFFSLLFCARFLLWFFYLIFTWVNNVGKVMLFNMITWFFVKYFSMNIQWDINNVSTVFISMKTFEVENYWQIEFHMSCLLAKGYTIFLCMII